MGLKILLMIIIMKGKIKIKVRFNETDPMRYLYHGNYASYYHASRTELLRSIGLNDKELEINGVILPVIELQSKYLKPAFYDDDLTVKTILSEISSCKLCFQHEVYNDKEEIINKGSTVVAYVNNGTRKPIKIPQTIIERLKFLIK
jgi:acyl-CoA thioester hydrolase